MEEQFILRVPPSVAERLDFLLSDMPRPEDQSLGLSFTENGRSGTFVIGNEEFPASLLDLPCIVESYKTYDDCSLVKTADIGQMVLVRGPGEPAPDSVAYKHGLTPPMKDARKRRFRRAPELNPELVERVEKSLLNIMAGRTTDTTNVEVDVQGENTNKPPPRVVPEKENAPCARDAIPKATAPAPSGHAAVPEKSDSDESEDSE